ncbi:Membrane-bound lytic murein transglycosylase C [Nitrospira sp. KM1]|uniref:murein transglycosylase domain-containing protein n=1 Tax=Nitrospira sp. KM1 TaxID=1936990 RepID=UPI0013A79398|nr:murein transglycosylase domain-containing protein [Nitrospira sp. KM1]BCA56812.1 Membrane-bound lytic murein transglycosylase C [Nitrospira sp. KM1]
MNSLPSRVLALIVLSLSLLSCESADRVVAATEQALASRTGKTVLDVVQGKNPSQVAKRHLDEYAKDPERLLNDLRTAQRDFQALYTALRGKVVEKWGPKEVTLPEKKKYVKYTQSYKSRAIVDFDRAEIVVETLDDKDSRNSLNRAIVTTLLTPQDPRVVDLFSDKDIPVNAATEPYLLGLVLDQQGKPIKTPEAADSFADYLIEKKTGTRTIEQDGNKKQATYVTMKMVANLSQKQADKYRPYVMRFAEQYKMSPSLVLAIIRTESNFNPYAVSSAPAYGLMQLVPTSGGREAYRRAKGQDVIPTRDYLFDPEANVELGTAFLNVLMFDQLDDVTNQVSREYCVIAAYNTGAGNVFKTFSKNRATAIQQINELRPATLYDKLKAKLPYQETRNYLEKVTTYRKGFVIASNASH